MSRRLAAHVLLLLAALPPAWAAQVRTMTMHEQDGRYVASFDAVIDAPLDKSLQLMLTPGLWPRLSPVIIDAKVLEKAENGPRKVSMTLYDCIFIFCKTIHKTEDITIASNGHIESLAIPEQSDFRYAREDWHISAEDGHTHILYKTEMVPSFFVPPLIGPYIIKSHLRSQLIHLVTNLEKLAQLEGKPPSDKGQ